MSATVVLRISSLSQLKWHQSPLPFLHWKITMFKQAEDEKQTFENALPTKHLRTENENLFHKSTKSCSYCKKTYRNLMCMNHHCLATGFAILLSQFQTCEPEPMDASFPRKPSTSSVQICSFGVVTGGPQYENSTTSTSHQTLPGPCTSPKHSLHLRGETLNQSQTLMSS